MAAKGGPANTMRSEKHAPLTGIAAVVLWVVGFIVLQGPADQPDFDSSAARVLDFFKDEPNAIILGGFLFMLGALFFLWFLGSLRAALHGAEGGVGRVATIAGGGGLATGICLLLMMSPLVIGAVNKKHLSEGAAQAFFGLSQAFLFAAELSAAVLLVATALVTLRTGALPRWVAWVSLVFALWLLIPPIGWLGLILGVPLWTVLVSWILYGRPVPPAPPPHTHQLVGTD